MMRLDFSGKTVLVTGGTRGIGLAIAHAFLAAGASVSITGTRAAGAYDADFAGLDYCRLDVRDEDAAKRLAADIPRLDVLVNNAGAALYRGQEFEMGNFRRILDINLSGMMVCCTAFHEALHAAGGNVVNLASVASILGTRGNPAYAASKGGVRQLTRSLAVAWARDGIRVNALAPGFVETDMTEVSWANDAAREAVLGRTPLRRWARPADMTGPALFLASNELAGFVTGAMLVADGGYSISA